MAAIRSAVSSRTEIPPAVMVTGLALKVPV
jgi:hypothetical protein